MEHTGALLQGIASVLWPVIILIVLFRFAPVLQGILETARSRKWTVKIGGQEISMEELQKQDRKLIEDLQDSVLALSDEAEPEPVSVPSVRFSRVLWVDDNPQNNSFEIQRLQDLDTQVDLSLSSSDAIRKLESSSYDLIIQDMGRSEPGGYNRTAGLDLIRHVRSRGLELPIFIMTSKKQVAAMRDQAISAGATLVTSSSLQLLNAIRKG